MKQLVSPSEVGRREYIVPVGALRHRHKRITDKIQIDRGDSETGSEMTEHGFDSGVAVQFVVRLTFRQLADDSVDFSGGRNA
jgi:hypothetical protein